MVLSNLDTDLILQAKYMYEKKKILVEKAFEQAKNELSKKGKSPRAAYINSLFEEKFGFAKNEKMFIRYYTDLVENNKDRYIDEITLDQLSKYVGYKDYDDFCKNSAFEKKINDSTTIKVSIDNNEQSFSAKEGSSFIFTLFNNNDNNQTFNLSDYITKHSGYGIIGALLCGSLFVGNKIYENVEVAPKQCMYWNGKEYIPEDCNNTKNRLIAIDMKLVDNFKKITCPDTIKSTKGIWYSKKNKVIEFFTADGKNPENNAELHELSDHMLETYILSKNSLEE
ncbi:MAG: hypothetical protein DI529_16425 [Chryseobacterium sp.]|nr:MAG: hypothetical protein DI529_16425 [Chryseobacterium sp.]